METTSLSKPSKLINWEPVYIIFWFIKSATLWIHEAKESWCNGFKKSSQGSWTSPTFPPFVSSAPSHFFFFFFFSPVLTCILYPFFIKTGYLKSFLKALYLNQYLPSRFVLYKLFQTRKLHFWFSFMFGIGGGCEKDSMRGVCRKGEGL